jgi:hypothetical protein
MLDASRPTCNDTEVKPVPIYRPQSVIQHYDGKVSILGEGSLEHRGDIYITGMWDKRMSNPPLSAQALTSEVCIFSMGSSIRGEATALFNRAEFNSKITATYDIRG